MTKRILTALDIILDELSHASGFCVLDIGCGKGLLRKPLRDAGFNWRGLDPFPPQLIEDIDVASADAMPYANKTFDAAICINALHHISVEAMAASLKETARILRPNGRIVVIEPRPTGALSQVIAVVDDETIIRRAAQTAMDQTKDLVEINAYEYARVERYDNFNVFCKSLIAVDPSRNEMIATREKDLKVAFRHHATRETMGWTLSQPMSTRVFRPA